MRIGYFLSSEEFRPREQVEQAVLAEKAGFRGALDQRPLPPVERRARAEPVRVGRHRRPVAGPRAAGHLTRESTVCGRDIDAHVEAFRPVADAGFDDVYISNVGPHYRDFFTLYADEVLPRLRQS